MLRHLKELIVDLNLDEAKYGDYALVATCFIKSNEPKNDFVRIEMPKNEKEVNACEKMIIQFIKLSSMTMILNCVASLSISQKK